MKKDLIFQSDNIICGRYKLGVNEMKIVLNFINLIEREDSDFWTYTIPAKNFNIEHKKLKASARALMNKPALEIPKEYNPKLPKDKQEWLFAHWFADIEYKDGCIEASFSPKLKPYFLKLKENFTAYNLRYILPMQGIYSIRIYQLLKSEQWKHNKVTYKLDYLYDILQVPKSYCNYAHFNRRVLKQAEKELKEHSDIYFKYAEVKDGKKVIEITFIIFNNEKNQVFKLNKAVSNFKNKIYKKYINKEIIVYKEQTYKCDNKGYLTLDGKKIEPEKAIAIWQYIYNNQDSLITHSFDYDINFESTEKEHIETPEDYQKRLENYEIDTDELSVHFGISQMGDRRINLEFELYLLDKLEEFKKVFAVDRNFKDLDISFKKYIQYNADNKKEFFKKL